jgi:ABC-type glycerol-3-phosphate transport system permease component
MQTFMVNGLLVTAVGLIVELAAGSLAGWFLARSRFARSSWVDAILIVLIAMPAQVLIIPTWELAQRLGIRDSLILLGIVVGTESLPFAILLFKSTFLAFPESLVEAAAIDGASPFGVFRRIVMPLTRGTFVAVAIIEGLGLWNELQMTLILITDPQSWTVPLAVASLKGQYSSAQEIMWAAVGISMVPALIFYLILNRQVTGGVRLGAVKG